MKDAMSFAFVRAKMLLARAIFAPLIMLSGIELVSQINTQWHPVTEWFEPIKLSVDDFRVGETPKTTYERHIKQPFIGAFYAYYENVDIEGFPICTFQSESFQYKSRNGTVVNPPLFDFMGKACALEPGHYRIVVTWTIKGRRWMNNSFVTLQSNVFEVLPANNNS